MTNTQTVQVLIAGGGPCGLMLANELGRRHISCLLVDAKSGTAFNPQANATQYLLGDEAENVKLTIADYFESTIGIQLFQSKLSDIVRLTSYPNLYIIPSHPELSEIQTKLESTKDALEKESGRLKQQKQLLQKKTLEQSRI